MAMESQNPNSKTRIEKPSFSDWFWKEKNDFPFVSQRSLAQKRKKKQNLSHPENREFQTWRRERENEKKRPSLVHMKSVEPSGIGAQEELSGRHFPNDFTLFSDTETHTTVFTHTHTVHCLFLPPRSYVQK